MKKEWSDAAWDDYLYWQTQDKKTLKKINELIKDIDRNGVHALVSLSHCVIVLAGVDVLIKKTDLFLTEYDQEKVLAYERLEGIEQTREQVATDMLMKKNILYRILKKLADFQKT